MSHPYSKKLCPRPESSLAWAVSVLSSLSVTALPGCIIWCMSGGLELHDLSRSLPNQAILWSYPRSSLGTQNLYAIFPTSCCPRHWEHRSSSPGGSSSRRFQGLVLLPPWSSSLNSISCWVAFGVFYFYFASSPMLFAPWVVRLSFLSLPCLSAVISLSPSPFSFGLFCVTNVRELK